MYERLNKLMNIIYYIEINLTCSIIISLFRRQLRRKSENYSTANNIFNILLLTAILLCASDMIAGILRGQVFAGAKMLIEISNLIFYISLTAISYLWMLYVYIKLEIINDFDKRVFLLSLPLLIFLIVAISNPFTHLLFIVDENNLFVRNTATYFHWTVTWLYMIIPTIKVILILVGEKSKSRKKDIIPFLYFIIAPTFAGIVQMLFYGISSSQVGVTISLVMISLSEQSNRIRSDSLTGLNNRQSFNDYIGSNIQRHSTIELSLLMIDINKFKLINDKFGHIVGDHALRDVADVLKNISGMTQNRLFLCRYGGDEFLIAAVNYTEEEINSVRLQIYEELEKKNNERKTPYILKVSVGLASGMCSNYADVQHLIGLSDQAMYKEKRLSQSKITSSK